MTGEVYKNSREKIIFEVSGFRGQQYGDMRVYYRDGEQWKPSKEGISVKQRIWQEFRNGIDQLESELRSGGLVGDAEMPQEPHTGP